MFSVAANKLNVQILTDQIRHPEAGGFVSFEGWVRNHNEGKEVRSLEYEVYNSLAIKAGLVIIQEAKAKFDIITACAVHRAGHLQIGDLAVWVGVHAKHRAAAFDACEYVINQIKFRLPIWKKEHYLDGQNNWVDCQACYKHAHKSPQLDHKFTESNFYEKQLLVTGFGSSGQDKLRQSKVLVVGAGGLGCPALSYLAGAGVGEITICDGDKLAASNLHRQVLYDFAEIDRYKAELAQERLAKLNPFIKIKTVNTAIDLSNAEALISGHDLVLDCTDNFEAKYLIHDICFSLQVTLLQASVYQTEGQIQLFDPKLNVGCYRCLWPQIPAAGSVGNCVEVGTVGFVPGTIGTMQAAEGIKYLLGLLCPSATRTLLVDLLTWDVSQIKRSKASKCPLCGQNPKKNLLTTTKHLPKEYEIAIEKLSAKAMQEFYFMDIRNLAEREHCLLGEDFLNHHPAVSEQDPIFLKSNKKIMLVCQKGIRSQILADRLRARGLNNIFSLQQGVAALKNKREQLRTPKCP